MKYRLRMDPVEPHFWSENNPHPAQEIAHEKDGIVIRTFGSGAGSKRQYLKEGDVILPTGLATVYQVLPRDKFDAQYEPYKEEVKPC